MCLLPSEASIVLTSPAFSPLVPNPVVVLNTGMPCLLSAICLFSAAQMQKASWRPETLFRVLGQEVLICQRLSSP